ncbi:MAG: FeoB small GTPase domain-containing protein, partial [Planctomycetota bacterium]|nr:FeoB small GTPase domain-containing protein [Planctomycetota bacterium]
MPHVPAARATMTVALIGNPNTGKSSLFGALVGVRQRVGNYPGVTVERRSGLMEYAGRKIEVVDLPGLYSLAPRSRDEMVAVDVLLGRQDGVPPVELVVCVLDAANLGRNLYLASQVLELGLPTVVAINMMDLAESRGIQIDCDRLAERLGVPVVATQAVHHVGIAELKAAMHRVAGREGRAYSSPLPPVFHQEIDRLAGWFLKSGNGSPGRAVARPLLERLVLDASGYLERSIFAAEGSPLAEELAALRLRLEQSGCAVPGVETRSRY